MPPLVSFGVRPRRQFVAIDQMQVIADKVVDFLIPEPNRRIPVHFDHGWIEVDHLGSVNNRVVLGNVAEREAVHNQAHSRCRIELFRDAVA